MLAILISASSSSDDQGDEDRAELYRFCEDADGVITPAAVLVDRSGGIAQAVHTGPGLTTVMSRRTR